METKILQINNLKLQLGKGFILDIEDLSVGKNEFVVVFGPNGAGKSTLLKAIMGFHRRKAKGDIRVFDKPIKNISYGELLKQRRQIGYLPQLSVAQSQHSPVRAYDVLRIGELSCNRTEKIEYWAEILGLKRVLNQPYYQLSGGEQRKTLIGAIMIREPKLLLLDEPTNHLDIKATEQVVELINQLFEQNDMSVILVTHSIETIPKCANRIIVLEDGKIKRDGAVEDILNSELISKIYDIDLKVEYVDGRFYTRR